MAHEPPQHAQRHVARSLPRSAKPVAALEWGARLGGYAVWREACTGPARLYDPDTHPFLATVSKIRPGTSMHPSPAET